MKTTGEIIVEDWRTAHGYTDPLAGLSDLSRRIDEALLSAIATAEGDVERLRALFVEYVSKAQNGFSGGRNELSIINDYERFTGRDFVKDRTEHSEALAKKEG